MTLALFESRWIPSSAKFVILGNHARGTGAMQVYEISGGDVKLVKEVKTCAQIILFYENRR